YLFYAYPFDASWRYMAAFDSYDSLIDALRGTKLVDDVEWSEGSTYLDFIHQWAVKEECESSHPPYVVDIFERHSLVAFELAGQTWGECEADAHQLSEDFSASEPWAIDLIGSPDPEVIEEYGEGNCLGKTIRFEDRLTAGNMVRGLVEMGAFEFSED